MERAKDLEGQRKTKEARLEKTRRERDLREAELRQWENGVQLIECGHVERA